MARVPYVEKGTADPEIRKLYEGFEAQFGVRGVPNVAKALANSPGLASKVFPLGNYFMNQSALEPRVRELAVLMLMKRCDCEYGFVRHVDIAKRVGLTQEQIDDIGAYSTSSRFNDDDKLILRYAEELTTKASADDDGAAKAAELADEQLKAALR